MGHDLRRCPARHGVGHRPSLAVPPGERGSGRVGDRRGSGMVWPVPSLRRDSPAGHNARLSGAIRPVSLPGLGNAGDDARRCNRWHASLAHTALRNVRGAVRGTRGCLRHHYPRRVRAAERTLAGRRHLPDRLGIGGDRPGRNRSGGPAFQLAGRHRRSLHCGLLAGTRPAPARLIRRRVGCGHALHGPAVAA